MANHPISSATRELVTKEIAHQKLPAEFIHSVEDFYTPLAAQLAQQIDSNNQRPCFVGLQGSQGSGKTTCAEFLKLIFESEHSLKTVVMSIDDFYLTKQQRQELAQSVHPLFVTRGVPGTHDINLLNAVFDDCAAGRKVKIPTFNKATDDRNPEQRWQIIDQRVDLVILEGWCVGIGAEPDANLNTPINKLEANEDPQAVWRSFVNEQLKHAYTQLFARLDYQIALLAPSFDCVYGWRLKQEQKLIARLEAKGEDASGAQTPEQIERFISHYQRLTEHALREMPGQADWLLYLNPDHSFRKTQSKHS